MLVSPNTRLTAILVALILSLALLGYGAEHRYTVSNMGRGLIIRTDRLTGRSQACRAWPTGTPEVRCGESR